MVGGKQMRTEKIIVKRKQMSKDRMFTAFCIGIALILTLIVLYPVVYVISASFSSPAALLQGDVWLWPVDFTLKGYKAVFDYKKVWIGYGNTIFYTVVGTLLNVSMTMLCAYPLSRKNLPGRGIIMGLFTFTMLFSGGLIPNYIWLKNLNMLDTRWAMLLPSAMSVYNMIVARTFIQNNIPEELYDAAKIDGSDDISFFFRIVLPLTKAVMAVLALWYAVSHWNSYFNAFIYLKDYTLYPLQIFLKDVLVSNSFSTAEMLNPESHVDLLNLKLLLKFSLIVVSAAPLCALYPFVQKYFVKGVTIGSVKG